MRFTWLACLTFVLVAPRVARAGDEIPEPRLDRVDYAHPEKYVALVDSLGKKETLEKIAAEIKGDSPRAKLGAIGSWIDAHLRYDAKSFDHWRDCDKLIADGTFGGCADHAEIFGAIARACGVPTVWVKTLDLDWIAWFRAHPDQPKNWSGHVFVEVNLEGRWRLYDATQKIVYDGYEVKQRILPGHRLAYDKGDDPYALMLSTRWEDWKKQTRQFVMSLDMSLVPVETGGATSLAGPPPAPKGAFYVAATHPAWLWAVERMKELGFEQGWMSGSSGCERWLPSAKNGILVVPCSYERTTLPKENWALLPVQPGKFAEALGEKTSAVVRKKAADGTDVVQVIAKDNAALANALAALTLDERPARPPRAVRPPVFVAAGAGFSAIAYRVQVLGFVASGGNAGFDKWMPSARGGILIVEDVMGESVLPKEYAALLPATKDEVLELLRTKESGSFRKKADDGTDVVLLAARDKDALRAAIESFTLDAPKPSAPAERAPAASDESKLSRVDPAGYVYVVGNGPEYEWVAKRCQALGFTVGGTGNCAYEKWLPNARRGIAVVISIDGANTLTGAYRSLLPVEDDKVREALKTKESEVFRKKAQDGTDVVLLAARDKDALRAALESFTLDPPK